MTALRGAELIATSLDEEPAERNRAALAHGSILCGYAIDSGAFALHHVDLPDPGPRLRQPPRRRPTPRSSPAQWPSWPHEPPTASSPWRRRSEPTPDDIEARILELGGNPPGLGDQGADRTKLPQALDAMLLRPELAFTPEPPTRADLEQLIERLGSGHRARLRAWRGTSPRTALATAAAVSPDARQEGPIAPVTMVPSPCSAITWTPIASRRTTTTRARHGVNPVLYLLARIFMTPFFLVYFRYARTGREHARLKGGLIVASNHRSFLDPFAIGGALPWRRPMNYVAKVELFERRWQGWILSRLGAFPIRRGESDEDSMETARLVVERGGAVCIFPEGTRIRSGSLGEPKRGVGRLALQTGAPVIPAAVLGTEHVRRGWRIRPRKVQGPARQGDDLPARRGALARRWPRP